MTLKDYNNSHNYCKTKAVANIIASPKSQHQNGIVEVTKHCKVDFEIPVGQTLALMTKVNNQIKDVDGCSKKNRKKFYKYKHRYIKHLLATGQVDKIFDAGNYYHFFIGNYDFHQLKGQFPNGFDKIDGKEEYEFKDSDEKFNMDDFVKCLLAIIEELPMKS